LIITKREITCLPRFINHKSARLLLKERYGKYVVMNSVDYCNGEKVYIYHFVIDQVRYIEWKDRKARYEVFDESIYFDTYQSIKITESGKIKEKF
jgi:hypothetical protein